MRPVIWLENLEKSNPFLVGVAFLLLLDFAGRSSPPDSFTNSETLSLRSSMASSRCRNSSEVWASIIFSYALSLTFSFGGIFGLIFLLFYHKIHFFERKMKPGLI